MQSQQLKLRKKRPSTNSLRPVTWKQWRMALPNLPPWNWILRMVFLQDCSTQELLAQASALWLCALKPSVARCKLAITARKKLNRQHSKLECSPQNSDRPKQAALDHVRSYSDHTTMPEYVSRRSPRKAKAWPQNLNCRAWGTSVENEVQPSNVWGFALYFLKSPLAELSATFWVTNCHKHRLTAKTGSASRVGSTYG